MRRLTVSHGSVRRLRPAALLLACGWTAACLAADPPPQWMVTLNGGSTDREGDGTRAYGSAALTRRLGNGYVRASVVRFGSAVRQVDVTLPSTYTIGFLSAGVTLGHWFVDGYAAGGGQRYRPIRTDLGRRAVSGADGSAVLGTGGDAGYVRRFGRDWSLTPSASIQYIRSKALREQIGPDGPGEYETRETGATFGGTLRLDRWLGRDRTSDLGLHVARYATTNISAALVSGTRGALFPDRQSGRRSDGWTEIGGNATARLSRSLYADVGLSRTFGAAFGDVTLTSIGCRLLF